MMGAESVTVRSDNVTELDDVLLLETEGETAPALSVKHHRPVVVYDLCASDTVVLAAAATNAPAATDKAVHYFQQQGKKVLRIADYPGLLVWRTVAMLINEALDAVQKASPARRMSIPRCALASTIRMARWHGENALAGGGCCNCWRTCNTIMARSAIAPVPCCARRR
nr:Probable 3-hydroxybutyryl-CoA dehydrogenase [Klebsiella pneumoniae]